ncbi:MAG TPA: hypothetical protein VMD59_17605, partial [Acidimicrobiales bacterium]|nr:hypothetical protein [Acidimicrobiales bacterium]
DAFSAGIIFGLAAGWDGQRTVDLATALYCLGQTIEGDLTLVSLEEAEAVGSGPDPARVRR